MPAAVIAICAGGLMLGRTTAGGAISTTIGARATELTAALGLVVTEIEVEGRVTTDRATILAALGADRGTPILAIDPIRAQQQLEALPWVRSAMIERRLPGTVYVRLVERRPLAVWQHDGKQQLIDSDGQMIPVADLSRFAHLPTVVGTDAAAHAAPLIDMLASEPELAARVTAAVRVDDRRWNLRIDHAIDVMLPEENPEAAWTRLAELDRTQSLLKRELQTVDMRLPDRLVLRTVAAPAPPAPSKKAHPSGKNT